MEPCLPSPAADAAGPESVLSWRERAHEMAAAEAAAEGPAAAGGAGGGVQWGRILGQAGKAMLLMQLVTGVQRLATQGVPPQTGAPALFNLQVDPKEKYNRADEKPELVNKIRQKMDSLAKAVGTKVYEPKKKKEQN